MIKAFVREDPARGQVFVHVIHRSDDGSRLGLRVEDGASSWEKVAPGCESPAAYVFSYEIAYVVAEAFQTLLEGHEDTRALRKDYDQERVRVDKMLAALIDISAMER